MFILFIATSQRILDLLSSHLEKKNIPSYDGLFLILIVENKPNHLKTKPRSWGVSQASTPSTVTSSTALSQRVTIKDWKGTHGKTFEKSGLVGPTWAKKKITILGRQVLNKEWGQNMGKNKNYRILQAIGRVGGLSSTGNFRTGNQNQARLLVSFRIFFRNLTVPHRWSVINAVMFGLKEPPTGPTGWFRMVSYGWIGDNTVHKRRKVTLSSRTSSATTVTLVFHPNSTQSIAEDVPSYFYVIS